MSDPQVESGKDRFERYETAKTRAELWRDDLEDAYELSLPVRNRFDNKGPGDPKTNKIFDTTAVMGVQSFANNIQSILMPPGKQWMTLKPGPNIPEEQRKSVIEQLQGINETVFKYLDASNFNLVMNEAIQDMAISTGVLLMNEGTVEKPFEFSCAPMADLAFEPGKNGDIENIWRKWKISLRQVKKQWPDAVMPQEFNQSSLKKVVDLIEGTIFYPDNEPGQQWFYYVQMVEGKKDIISEYMEFSPWIAFRFNVTPGEVIGFGPVMKGLNTIKYANKMKQLEMKVATFRAFPSYTAPNSGTINPHTLRLEPGSIIPIEPSFVGQKPIDIIPQPSGAQYVQVSLEQLQTEINNFLFAEPLGPPTGPNATATEVSTRQQNWVRKSTAAFGRLNNELITPVMDNALLILRKKGLIKPIFINNVEVIKIDVLNLGIDFESPIFALQDQEDFQRVVTLMQTMQEIIAPQASLLSMNVEKLPGWMAEKLDVDMELIKDETQIQAALKQLNNAQQQQQQQQQIAAGQAQPPTPQPPQDPIMNQVPVQTS